MPYKDKNQEKLYQQTYRQKNKIKAKEYMSTYIKTKKYKDSRKRYQITDAYKMSHKAAYEKYKNTLKCKISRALYRETVLNEKRR
jgi:hypothetical protein